MKTQLTIAIALTLSLSACATPKRDYACGMTDPGMPCSSVEEVYAATHYGQIDAPAGKAARPNRGVGAGAGNEHAFEIALEGDSLLLVDAEPPAYEPDAPVVAHPDGPRRTAARILRIWLSPWEDELGDLHMAGHVYSEIEGRRWQVGVKAPDVTPSLELLLGPEAVAKDAAPR